MYAKLKNNIGCSKKKRKTLTYTQWEKTKKKEYLYPAYSSLIFRDLKADNPGLQLLDCNLQK